MIYENCVLTFMIYHYINFIYNVIFMIIVVTKYVLFYLFYLPLCALEHNVFWIMRVTNKYYYYLLLLFTMMWQYLIGQLVVFCDVAIPDWIRGNTHLYPYKKCNQNVQGVLF